MTYKQFCQELGAYYQDRVEVQMEGLNLEVYVGEDTCIAYLDTISNAWKFPAKDLIGSHSFRDGELFAMSKLAATPPYMRGDRSRRCSGAWLHCQPDQIYEKRQQHSSA